MGAPEEDDSGGGGEEDADGLLDEEDELEELVDDDETGTGEGAGVGGVTGFRTGNWETQSMFGRVFESFVDFSVVVATGPGDAAVRAERSPSSPESQPTRSTQSWSNFSMESEMLPLPPITGGV